MALLGLWAVSLVESIGPAFLLVSAAFVLASLYFNLNGRTVFSGLYWNVLAIAVFAFFLADYIALSGELITSASRFLTVLLALKLFDLKKDRDYLVTYGLVFFQVLAAAASTVSISFFAILALYIVAAIWAMVVLNMKRDAEASLRGGPLPKGLFGPWFFASILMVSVISIVITFTLFFAIPRMGVGFFERKTLNTIKVTGFSDRVELGSIGPVKEDSTVVMRVAVTRRPGTLYFRGSALSTYDGKGWSRPHGGSRLLRKGADGTFYLRRPSGEVLEQEIMLEPLETDAVFAASEPFRVDAKSPNLWLDPGGSVRLPSPPYSRIEYRAWSSLSPYREAPLPDASVYTDSSYLGRSPEGAMIRKLAADITALSSTDYQKAEAIEGHLRKNYRYTLDPKKGGGSGPLEDFLFHAKEGYCEHYATAMVMLLRSAGVPSRIVTGFLEGEWNGLGNYFIVRQRDAHSWVEAYINGNGWVRFDPTPAAGTVSTARPSVISLYMDLLRLKWNRYIIQYSFSDQRRLGMAAESRASGAVESIKGLFSPARMPGLNKVVPAVAAVAVIFALALLIRSASRSKKGPATPSFYTEMLKALSRKGLIKRDDETPLEFAKRCSDERVVEITLAFQKKRYGGAELDGAEMERIRTAIEVLKKGA